MLSQAPVHDVPRPWPTFLSWLLSLLIAATFLVFLRSHADAPIGVRLDSWSESNILVSARNAERNGWAAYGGVAQHQVDRPPFVSDPLFFYAHYPLGASYLSWLAYRLVGEDTATMRWLPALASTCALLLWFAFVSRVAGARVGIVAMACLATTYAFVSYADDLHHSYPLFCLTGLLVVVHEAGLGVGRRRETLLAVGWLLLLVCSFLSWEWYLWAQVVIWGAALFVTPLPKRWLVAFTLVPVLAFSVHTAVRNRAFGEGEGSASTTADLLRRTVRLEETADTPPGVTLATLPAHIAQRFEQFYGETPAALLWVGLGATLLSGWATAGAGGAGPLRWLVLLLVSGISWWAVMWQHTAVHQHVMRHVVLFYGFALGSAVERLGALLYGRGSRAAVRLMALILLGVTIGPHLGRFWLDVRLHGDDKFKHPYGWTGAREEAAELKTMADALPRDAIVLTNYDNRLPLLRYWLDVPVYAATFERYPFRAGAPLPEARIRLELTAAHLATLYPAAASRPRMVYLYMFRGDPSSRYIADPLLWQLVDGSWSKPTGYDRLVHFQQIMAGTAQASHPVVARGARWICFEASDLIDKLPPGIESKGDPTRAEYGPPR